MKNFKDYILEDVAVREINETILRANIDEDVIVNEDAKTKILKTLVKLLINLDDSLGVIYDIKTVVLDMLKKEKENTGKKILGNVALDIKNIILKGAGNDLNKDEIMKRLEKTISDS